MRKLFLPDGHVSEPALGAFAVGELEREEMLAVAEHVAACEACAGRLARCVEAGGTADPPAGFEEEVRRRLPRRRSRAELFLYSARVAIAACAALFLISSGALRSLAGPQNSSLSINAPGFGTVQQISTRLNGLSQQILHWEVFHHAKEKK